MILYRHILSLKIYIYQTPKYSKAIWERKENQYDRILEIYIYIYIYKSTHAHAHSHTHTDKHTHIKLYAKNKMTRCDGVNIKIAAVKLKHLSCLIILRCLLRCYYYHGHLACEKEDFCERHILFEGDRELLSGERLVILQKITQLQLNGT